MNRQFPRLEISRSRLRHNMAEEYLFLYTLYLHLHLALLL